MTRSVGILALVTVVCGCVSGTGRFASSGEYLHNNYPVRVGYTAAEPGKLLGPEWRLDNFSVKDGKPGAQKLAGSYVTTRQFDLDDDGKYERPVEGARHDLRFEHRKTGASIWFALVPQSSTQRDLELRVLARSMADDLSGGVGAAAITPKGVIITVDQRYASIVTSTANCKLGAVEAYQADFVVADVDQLKLDPSSRSRRVRLMIARPGYSTKSVGGAFVELPVLLVAGISALPEDFTSHEGDFGRFIAAIGLGDPKDGTPPAEPSRVSCDAPKSTLAETPAASSPAPTPSAVVPPAASAAQP